MTTSGVAVPSAVVAPALDAALVDEAFSVLSRVAVKKAKGGAFRNYTLNPKPYS